jgi:hypothetical protein
MNEKRNIMGKKPGLSGLPAASGIVAFSTDREFLPLSAVQLADGLRPQLEHAVSDAILLIIPSEVYRNDAEARDAGMALEEKLRFHQQQSKPIIDGLHDWLKAQFAERKLPRSRRPAVYFLQLRE